MKAKLIHHSFEWLEGDYDPPEELATKTHLTVWRMENNYSSKLVAMKLDHGTGIWTESGKLIHYVKLGADLHWVNNSMELLSLELRFGTCQQQKGIGHTLRRLKAETYNVINEMDICVDSGGVELLVLNNSGNRCLVTWLDQGCWGYIFIDLVAMKQLPDRFSFRPGSLAPPSFSPDDSVVISCNYYKSGWWTDEIDDSWDYPCLGGLRKVGVINVHDVVSDIISNHEVLIDMPEGWIPVDPDNSDWDTIWGPEFISKKEFRIWLPDGSSEVLSLPLPTRIEIQRGLSTEKQD
jgi:hypothetical protein